MAWAQAGTCTAPEMMMQFPGGSYTARLSTRPRMDSPVLSCCMSSYLSESKQLGEGAEQVLGHPT